MTAQTSDEFIYKELTSQDIVNQFQVQTLPKVNEICTDFPEFFERIYYKGRLFWGKYGSYLFEHPFSRRDIEEIKSIDSADWSIKNGKLYLTDFDGSVKYKNIDRVKRFKFKHFFRGKSEVFAEWYTGTISFSDIFELPCTEGYFIRYKMAVNLTIENGVVTKESIKRKTLPLRDYVPKYIIYLYCFHNEDDEINDDMFLNEHFGQGSTIIKEPKIKIKLSVLIEIISNIPWLISGLLVRLIVFPFALIHLLKVCITYLLDNVYFKSLKFLAKKF